MKNKYDTCRVEVSDSDSAVLVLGLPPDFGARMVETEVVEAKNKTVKEEKPVEDLRSKRQLEETTHDCGIVDMVIFFV